MTSVFHHISSVLLELSFGRVRLIIGRREHREYPPPARPTAAR
jgi:hypothetical protein